VNTALEKWQATIVVLAVIAAATFLAFERTLNVDVVVTGLFSIANLVLGAGAVAHGVRQGSKASSDPPADA
jgi:hypothetical protein